MIKVLMLNYEFPPLGGGAANATKYILKELSKEKDIEIDLVTSSAHRRRLIRFAPKIRIFYLNIGKTGGNMHYQSNKDLLNYSHKAYKKSKRLLKKNEYDVVHAFFGIPCGYIAKRLGAPYIVSLRGSDVPFYNKRFEKLDKLIFKRLSKNIWDHAEYVISNSEGLKELAISSSPDQKIGVIPNGIDIKEFKQKTYPNRKILKVLSVGRLIERKGFSYLIESMKGLKGATLTIAGDGPLKKELTALAKKEGVKLELLGNVPHEKVAKVYQSHDVFVLPSQNEGMSNTVLEAMASGLPLILSDTGGTSELIKGNGYVVPVRDSGEISKYLKQFIKSRGLIKIKGSASRKIAEGMSWNSVAKDYLKLYKKIKDER